MGRSWMRCDFDMGAGTDQVRDHHLLIVTSYSATLLKKRSKRPTMQTSFPASIIFVIIATGLFGSSMFSLTEVTAQRAAARAAVSLCRLSYVGILRHRD